MTLIATDISRHGIVLVGDSAIFERLSAGEFSYSRVLTNVRKIFPILNSRAGLGVWGAGQLPGRISAEFWIRHFLWRNGSISNVEMFANMLTGELNAQFGGGVAELGFHVTGYNDGLPVMYRITNASEKSNALGEFKMTWRWQTADGFPPQPVTYWDGDVHISNAIRDHIQPVFDATAEVSVDIPAQDLESRRDFLALHIRYMSDLYACSKMPRSIGGDVFSLILRPDGSSYPTPADLPL